MRIALCGDIALWRGAEEVAVGSEGRALVRDFGSVFSGADLSIANVECPLTDSDRPQWDYFRTLKGKKAAGGFLRDLGIQAGSLANNHIADYGKRGLADTIGVLDELGISWVGAGWSPEEARRPLILQRGGQRIGILALAQPEISAATRLGWGAGVLEDEYALNCVSQLSKEVEIAIAYLHCGVEFSEFPTPHQVRLSRALVDAGAKLVIGHHPHVPQGYELYKDGFIAYSLGNFIFDMADGPHRFSRLGLVVQADFLENKLTDVNVLPVDTRGGVTKVLPATEVVEAEMYLTHLCSVVADKEKLQKAYYFTCRNNLEMNINAVFHNAVSKKNWRQARDIIVQQFWPQFLSLRKDLFRFVLLGEAARLEINKGPLTVKRGSRLWRLFCRLLGAFG